MWGIGENYALWLKLPEGGRLNMRHVISIRPGERSDGRWYADARVVYGDLITLADFATKEEAEKYIEDLLDAMKGGGG